MASSEQDNLNKCRLCLKIGEFPSIFSSFPGSVLYSEIAMGCSNIQIFKGDGLPNMVCEECIEKLNFIHDFKEQCETCDSQLRMTLPKIYDIEKKVEMIAPEIESCGNLLEERYSIKDTSTSITNEINVYPISLNRRLDFADDFSNHPVTPTELSQCPLNCSVCGRIFDNIFELSAHKMIHMHSNESNNEALTNPNNNTQVTNKKKFNFICNLCKKGVKGKVTYQEHLHKCKLKTKAKTLCADVIVKYLRRDICPVCKAEFEDRFTLKKHFKNRSPCGYAMRSRIRTLKGNLTYSIMDVDRVIEEISQIKKIVQCSNCKDKFETYSLMLLHFRKCLKLKGTIEISCIECKLVFYKKHCFYKHVHSRHISILGSPIINVNIDRLKSLSTRPSDNLLVSHNNADYEDTELKNIVNQCNYCLNSFQTEKLLSIHSAHYCRHNNILRKKPTCHICSKTFSLSVQLNCHLKIQHSMDSPNTPFLMKPPVCDFCFTTFKDRMQMVKHRGYHFIKQFYFCKLCKESISKAVSSKHKRRHLNSFHKNYINDPINCEQCEEKFTCLRDVMIHYEMIHHKKFELFVPCNTEKNFETCPICNIDFPSLFLTRHIYFHENYKCKKCFKYFFSEIIFQKHICNQINEPEKAIQVPSKSDPVEEYDITDIYDCEFCFRSISNRYKISHSERHFRPMQYGCILCYKKFSSKSPLKRHISNHQKHDYTMNPLICRHCGKTFVRYNSYSNHVLDVHNAPENMVVLLEFPPQLCLICHKSFSFIHRHYRCHKEMQCVLCKKYILSSEMFSRHICDDAMEDPTLAVTFSEDISNLLKPDYEHHHKRMILRQYPINDPLGDNNLDPLSCVEISLNPTADDTSYDDFSPKISSVVSLTEIKQEADRSLDMNTIVIKDEPINNGYDY